MEIIVDTVVSFVDFVMVLTRPLPELVFNILYKLIFTKKTLPPILNEILLMSATTLARKIRRREVSCVEVMNAYIGRIGGVQPAINACVDNRFEEALADARTADALIEEGRKSEAELEAELPLLGVPFSCKEMIGVRGLAQTFGLKSMKDRKAPRDSDVAALYRKAGAIPVVVTNVPTMSLWLDTYNPVFGTTNNPYDTFRSAGGSSGGEAALIASAGSVIGIGNDLAGSVRFPASLCGIYGHKPSRGVISNNSPSFFNVPEIQPFLSTGPMCRYVEDLPLLVGILAGEDRKRLRLHEEVDFRNVKVYYMEELPGFLLSATSDIKAAVRKAVKHFEDEYGITPEPLRMKEMAYAFQMWQREVFESAGAFVRSTIAGEGEGGLNLPWEYLKATFGFSDYEYRILYFTCIEPQKKDAYHKKCLAMFKVVQERLRELLGEGNALLVLPVQPYHPPFSTLTVPKLKTIGYTGIFNALGMPGTAVPAGVCRQGLPIGLQVIAAQDNDRLTLAAAAELDKVFGGWQSPCSIIV